MRAGAYVGGALFLAVTVVAAACAAELVRRRRLSHLAGSARVAAQGLLTTIALALTVFVPGVFGVLTRGSAVACALLLAAAAALIPPSISPSLSPSPEEKTPRPAAARINVAISLGAALVILAWILGELLHTATSPLSAIDFTSYDLPVIGGWIQTGSLWHITELFPLQTHGTYPQNAHVVIAAVILPFHNDAFVRFLIAPYLPLAAISVYATGEELGAPRTTAVAFAAMFAALPLVALDAEAGPPDTIALAAFAAGVLFLVRHFRTRLRSDLLLAALGLGFAAGTLWYFSSAVAVLALVWTAATLLRARGRRESIARAGLFIGVIAASSGFWLVRNLVGTGDPIYPVRVAVAGIKVFSPPHDVYRAISGFSIADYLGNTSVLRHFIVPALRKATGLPGLIALAGFLWAGLQEFVGRRRGRPPDPLRRVLLLATLLLTVLYVFTPYSAFGVKNQPTLAWVNVRYLFPAVTLAVALAAAAVGRAAARARTAAELAALAATVQGAVAAYHLEKTGRTAVLGGGLAIVVLGVCAFWLWQRVDLRALRSPRLVATTAVLGGAAVLVAGYGVQRRLNRERYAPYDATYAWIQDHPGVSRIGLAGSWDFAGVPPAWAMFGPRLANRVSFVGPFHDGQLRQFATSKEWLQALRDGRYDLLEIARNAPPRGTSDNDLKWARLAKLPIVSESPRFELVRADPLPPS